MKTEKLPYNNVHISRLHYMGTYNILERINDGYAFYETMDEIFIIQKVVNEKQGKDAYEVFSKIFKYEDTTTKMVVKDLMTSTHDKSYLHHKYDDIEILQYYVVYAYNRRLDKTKPIGITGLYANYDSNTAHIAWFGVLKNYRKLGIGTKMLELTEAVAILQGYRDIEVFSHYNVYESPAHDFYINYGFEMFDIIEPKEDSINEDSTNELEFHFTKSLLTSNS